MKQYQDERELAAAFLRILNKLYILRNLDDVPANLTFNNLSDRLISNQSLAILNPDEQDLLLLFIRHENIYRQILSSGNPYIMEGALSKLSSYDRVIVQILRLISENRGTHPDGGYRLTDEDEKRYCRKQRSRMVLAWVLRSLNISDHPIFVPLSIEPILIENTIRKYKQALIKVHPDYEDVLLSWEHDLDNIKLIINRKINRIEVPQQMFDRLSPEGEDLYEFFYCLILRQNNRLAESYLEQYAPVSLTIARQNFLWILNQKNILDDLDNPPYSVSASQVIEQLYGSDARGLDQRSIDFLNNRRENFAVYNEIMSIPDADEFVQAFNSLQAEDQAFISVLQSIDKFYSEHGCNNPSNDSWYSPDFYEHLYLGREDAHDHSQRFYSNYSSEADNNEEREDYERFENSKNSADENYGEEAFSNQKADAADNEQEKEADVNKVDDYEQAFLSLLSHSKDESYDLAYNRTISILLKTGFIKDPVNPPKYDPQKLFYSLTDKDSLHLVEGDDVKFLIERSLNTAIYLSIFRLDAFSRQRLIDSLQSQDRGFIMALLSLEDKDKVKNADGSPITQENSQEEYNAPDYQVDADDKASDAEALEDNQSIKVNINESSVKQDISGSLKQDHIDAAENGSNADLAASSVNQEKLDNGREGQLYKDNAETVIDLKDSEINSIQEQSESENSNKEESESLAEQPEAEKASGGVGDNEAQSSYEKESIEDNSQAADKNSAQVQDSGENSDKEESESLAEQPEAEKAAGGVGDNEEQSSYEKESTEGNSQAADKNSAQEHDLEENIDSNEEQAESLAKQSDGSKAEIAADNVRGEEQGGKIDESTAAQCNDSAENRNTEAAAGSDSEVRADLCPLDPIAKARSLTAGILRSLDLCVDLDMDGDGSVCADLKELFDKLYTLDSFIVLDKEDQLFLYKRRDHLALFLEIAADDSKLSKLEGLSDEDKGFFAYLQAVNFGM